MATSSSPGTRGSDSAAEPGTAVAVTSTAGATGKRDCGLACGAGWRGTPRARWHAVDSLTR